MSYVKKEKKFQIAYKENRMSSPFVSHITTIEHYDLSSNSAFRFPCQTGYAKPD